MANYTSATKQLIGNYACISTLEPTEIGLGESITVTGLTSPFNGTFTVLALPQYEYTGIDPTTGEFLYNVNEPRPNQIIYACTGSNVEFVVSYAGTITYNQVCTWVSATDVEDWLGIGTATAADATFLTLCAAAASAFCHLRRQECGYHDSLTVLPSTAVGLGTRAYGGFLYRQRGSVSDFASFDGMVSGGSNGLSPMIKQLLGVNRAQVA
jgi:hypothetical protein